MPKSSSFFYSSGPCCLKRLNCCSFSGLKDERAAYPPAHTQGGRCDAREPSRPYSDVFIVECVAEKCFKAVVFILEVRDLYMQRNSLCENQFENQEVCAKFARRQTPSQQVTVKTA